MTRTLPAQQQGPLGEQGRSPWTDLRAAAPVIAAVIIVSSLMVATFQRNRTWHSLLSLWTDCAAKSPDKSRTHNNLGNCYMLLGRHFQAISEYERAIELDPNNIEAYYNLAINLDKVGFAGAAVKYYAIFCERAPKIYESSRTRACLRLQELSVVPAQ